MESLNGSSGRPAQGRTGIFRRKAHGWGGGWSVLEAKSSGKEVGERLEWVSWDWATTLAERGTGVAGTDPQGLTDQPEPTTK